MFKFLASLCCLNVFLPSVFQRRVARTKEKAPANVALSTTPASSHRLQGSTTEKKARLQITHMGLAPTNPFADQHPFKGTYHSSLVILPPPSRIPTSPQGERRTPHRHSRRTQSRSSHPKPLKRRAILAYKKWRQASHPRASGRFSYVPPGFTMVQPTLTTTTGCTNPHRGQPTPSHRSSPTPMATPPGPGPVRLVNERRRSSDATVVQLPSPTGGCDKCLWDAKEDEPDFASTANTNAHGACCEANHRRPQSVNSNLPQASAGMYTPTGTGTGTGTPETFATALSEASFSESPRISAIGITPPTPQGVRFSGSWGAQAAGTRTRGGADLRGRGASSFSLANEETPRVGLGSRKTKQGSPGGKENHHFATQNHAASSGHGTLSPKPFVNRPLSPRQAGELSLGNATASTEYRNADDDHTTPRPATRPLRHAGRRNLRSSTSS